MCDCFLTFDFNSLDPNTQRNVQARKLRESSRLRASPGLAKMTGQHNLPTQTTSGLHHKSEALQIKNGGGIGRDHICPILLADVCSHTKQMPMSDTLSHMPCSLTATTCSSCKDQNNGRASPEREPSKRESSAKHTTRPVEHALLNLRFAQ